MNQLCHFCSYILIFRKLPSLETPSSPLARGRHMHPSIFCMKLNVQVLLFEAFSNRIRIFGTILPSCESTLPFLYILIFQKWLSLEPPSSPLAGDRHIRSLTFWHEIDFTTVKPSEGRWCQQVLMYVGSSTEIAIIKWYTLSSTTEQVGKIFFSWFYKISSCPPLHLNYTSFPFPKQQQPGF